MLVFLCCLIMLLVCFPFIQEWYANYLGLVEIFFTLLLTSGIYVISRDPQAFMLAFLIAVLSMIIMWFNIFLSSTTLLVIGVLLQITFFIITIVTILSHISAYQKVNADTIYGAISAYLLIGIIWAMIYTILEITMPGSFKLSHTLIHNNAFLAGHRFYFSQFIYFSFITLTTLGYGDITPLSLASRGFASLEAIMGQLYIAVLIARLVGLHISHTHWEQIKQEKKTDG